MNRLRQRWLAIRRWWAISEMERRFWNDAMKGRPYLPDAQRADAACILDLSHKIARYSARQRPAPDVSDSRRDRS